MDYGLLGGLAEGLKQGLESYRDTKKANEERETRAKQMALQTSLAKISGHKEGFDIDDQGVATENAFGKAQEASNLAKYDPNSEQNKQLKAFATSHGYGDVPIDPETQKEIIPAIMKGEYGVKEHAAASAAKSASESKKDFITFQNELDPNRARSGNLAKYAQNVAQSEHLEGLLARGHNLDQRETEELAIGLQKLLGSGNPSAEQVKALVPASAQGNTEKLKEFLFNDPRGLNNQAFIERLGRSISTQKEISIKQKKEAQYEKLAAFEYLKEADPDKFHRLLKSKGLDYNEYQRFVEAGGHLVPPGLMPKGMMGPGGGAPNVQQAGVVPSEQPQYEADVLSYASQHGITPAQAQKIKLQRGG